MLIKIKRGNPAVLFVFNLEKNPLNALFNLSNVPLCIFAGIDEYDLSCLISVSDLYWSYLVIDLFNFLYASMRSCNAQLYKIRCSSRILLRTTCW
jgi:hypothetical protein